MTIKMFLLLKDYRLSSSPWLQYYPWYRSKGKKSRDGSFTCNTDPLFSTRSETIKFNLGVLCLIWFCYLSVHFGRKLRCCDTVSEQSNELQRPITNRFPVRRCVGLETSRSCLMSLFAPLSSLLRAEIRAVARAFTIKQRSRSDHMRHVLIVVCLAVLRHSHWLIEMHAGIFFYPKFTQVNSQNTPR